MGIFNFLKKRAQPSSSSTDNLGEAKRSIETSGNDAMGTLATDMDFVDTLISFFKSQPEVSEAYFGFLHNQQTNRNHLFLSVDHNGDETFIMQQTWNIKTQCQPSLELHFASNTTDVNLFEAVKQSNFPFYNRVSTDGLQVLLVKHYFNANKYRKELIEAIKNGTLVTLFFDYDPSKNVLNFQTYKRPTGEFIPLFSSREMIDKSGMKEVPKNLTVIQFDYKRINELVNFEEKKQFFVLNPGTAFEFEFFA